MEVLSAAAWRTDRVNVFAYGRPGAGKTHFAATFPDPVFIDLENGILTVGAVRMRLGLPDCPVVQPATWRQVIAILQNPEGVLRDAFRGTEWQDYPFKTIVVDTVSTLEDLVLREILRETNDEIPDLQHYRPLAQRMRPIFSAAWRLPYNTVLLAHDHEGGIDMRKRGARPPSPPGPLLTGSTRKQGPGVADFFLLLRDEPVGPNVKYVAYRSSFQDYPARVRGVEPYLDYRIENPSFAILRAALDRLVEEKAARLNGQKSSNGKEVIER